MQYRSNYQWGKAYIDYYFDVSICCTSLLLSSCASHVRVAAAGEVAKIRSI